jgi:hypothetical protein
VAVDAGHRWVLHCGDAFYFEAALHESPTAPRIVTAWELFAVYDRKLLHDNRTRLAELYRRQEPGLFIVSSHDSSLYEKARATA